MKPAVVPTYDLFPAPHHLSVRFIRVLVVQRSIATCKKLKILNIDSTMYGVAGGKQVLKETGLGLSISKNDNFGDWYSELVVKSQLIGYYAISGCYILWEDSYSMWERIQQFFDAKIKSIGVKNAYFPLFITEDVLNAEKDHVEGFAPEVG